MRSTVLVLVSALLLAACAAPEKKSAIPFPQALKQIDATPRAMGSGSCTTTRTGLWAAEGGFVVEVQRPQQCSFDSLFLVVNGKHVPLTAVDTNFYRGPRWIGGVSHDLYVWTGKSGRLFFRSAENPETAIVSGILEKECMGGSCLDEKAALASAPRAAR
jgi:hypothetical protein